MNVYQQAQAAYARNDLDGARRLCLQILDRIPDDVHAAIMLGIVDARSGRLDAAVDRLNRALKLEPNSFEAHTAMSTVLGWSGRIDESLEHSRKAVESNREDPDGYVRLGLGLKSSGQFDEAIEVFRRAAAIAPANIPAAQNYAAALQDCRRDTEARAAWQRVTALAPQNWVAWFSLGQLHLMLGEFDDAVRCARRAAALKPDQAKSQLLLALALSESGDTAKAETHIRKAISLDPTDGVAHAALGFWLQEEGDFESSLNALEQTIKHVPNHGFAYYNLYRCKKASESDADQLRAMREKVSSGQLTLQDESYMNYALGKAAEDTGQYEQAIGLYDEANRLAFQMWLANRPWDRESYAARFSDTIRNFDSDAVSALSSNGDPTETPLIIVGMMRSGTSLVEQILSSHPEIAGAGELTFWHGRDKRIFDGSRIDEPLLRKAAKDYTGELARLGYGKRFVTDKLPHNYALLGMMCAALPHAKFVHVRRNPIDNCLSIYTTAYQRPPVFGHDRENIVFAYREYLRLMDHWRRILPPGTMIEVDYEELVGDRESVTRRLIEFCGLPWDDRCLDHESNSRSVRTPSLWQVRQPIYKTSVERWRRFEPWIAPFDSFA